MKFKRVIIPLAAAAAVVGIGIGIGFAVRSANQDEVGVIAVSSVASGFYGNNMSISGNISSDVSQDVHLLSGQLVDQVFVKEGDTVSVGTPLLSYDMTLVNLDLEIEKLNKDGINLKLQAAEKELKKLKNTKPSSGSGGSGGADFGGGDVWFPDDGGVSDEELYPDAVAYDRLDFNSVPYTGEGTKENPYRFLCKQNAVVTGAFMNKVAGFLDEAGTQKDETSIPFYCYLEIRQDDKPDGTLLRAWYQDGSVLEPFAPEWEARLQMDMVPEEPTPTPTPDPGEPTPTPTPDPGEPTPTPDPGEPTPTPDPGEPTPTPDPGEPTPTPDPDEPTPTPDALSFQYMSDFRKNLTAEGRYHFRSTATGSGGVLTPVTPDEVYQSYTKEELQKQIVKKEQDIRGLKLDLKQSDLKIKNKEDQLKNQNVTSTINGVVKSVGDPAKGEVDGKPFIQVVSSEGLYVTGMISELMLEEIKVGQQLFGYSYESGTSFEAEIREISPYPASSNYYGGMGNNNVSYYPFTAYIAEADGLKNMEYVELNLTVGASDASEDDIYLSNALVRTDSSENYVMIRGENGRLKKQPVTIGKTVYGNMYEIIDGLTREDMIAFPYARAAKEGAKTREVDLDEFYQ